MNVFTTFSPLVVLGLVAGVIGAMFGIGGGLIMVPALILLFAFEQRTATGTSLLAQLLPVGLLGVAEYWRRGELNVGAGLAMAAGLFVGSWAGARLVGSIPRDVMRQAYGVFLVVVGLYFLLVPTLPKSKLPGAPLPGDAAPAVEQVER
jgi:uncharacterized membrane protein YfcA